jgi:hypothetical protein
VDAWVPTAQEARAVVVPWDELTHVNDGDVEVAPLAGSAAHDGVGTMFVIAGRRAEVALGGERFPVPAGGFAVVPSVARISGSQGVIIVHRRHRGLFVVGGPVEQVGRLAYIDGCSDTVLVQPVVRGDPCLNLLHLPPGTVQSDHDHPSLRVGFVLSGVGRCVLGGGATMALTPATVFVLPARETHRFETDDQALRLVAWHPDSDVGPSHDDHPMLNRTLRPGTDQRVR